MFFTMKDLKSMKGKQSDLLKKLFARAPPLIEKKLPDFIARLCEGPCPQSVWWFLAAISRVSRTTDSCFIQIRSWQDATHTGVEISHPNLSKIPSEAKRKRGTFEP